MTASITVVVTIFVTSFNDTSVWVSAVFSDISIGNSICDGFNDIGIVLVTCSMTDETSIGGSLNQPKMSR